MKDYGIKILSKWICVIDSYKYGVYYEIQNYILYIFSKYYEAYIENAGIQKKIKFPILLKGNTLRNFFQQNNLDVEIFSHINYAINFQKIFQIYPDKYIEDVSLNKYIFARLLVYLYDNGLIDEKNLL